MNARKKGERRRTSMGLVETSPLRPFDPRAKLALCLCASLAVMLPVERILIVIGLYAVVFVWARLWREALRELWQLRWILFFLFLGDWLLVGIDLAVIVTLRLILLAGTFTLFFATTTPGELCLALEWLKFPYRYAFSVSLAFQSVSLLDEEWQGIREAQQARGAWTPPTGWREIVAAVRDLVALTVPAIVMTTRRAWWITEAAYARGFDSPHRRPYRRLRMKAGDWVCLLGALACSLVLLLI